MKCNSSYTMVRTNPIPQSIHGTGMADTIDLPILGKISALTLAARTLPAHGQNVVIADKDGLILTEHFDGSIGLKYAPAGADCHTETFMTVTGY